MGMIQQAGSPSPLATGPKIVLPHPSTKRKKEAWMIYQHSNGSWGLKWYS